MAYVRHYGRPDLTSPDLFFTLTTNPKWPDLFVTLTTNSKWPDLFVTLITNPKWPEIFVTPTTNPKRPDLFVTLTTNPKWPDLFVTLTTNPKWPDLFVTLTQNPKWPEGQKAHNRPGLTVRVFRLKLQKFLDYLKNGVFGDFKLGCTLLSSRSVYFSMLTFFYG